MASKYPYISGNGGIVSAITQFRKSLPRTIDAETFRKLAIAANNESYLINILRFVGVADENGAVTEAARTAFSQHSDAEFNSAFGKMVRAAYDDLFALHGDAAWKLSQDPLVAFFRSSDKTSEIVGKRQASTFQALAALAGQAEGGLSAAPAKKASSGKAQRNSVPRKPTEKRPAVTTPDPRPPSQGDVSLTVRIEVNLPVTNDQEVYDKIFRSIREHLLDGSHA